VDLYYRDRFVGRAIYNRDNPTIKILTLKKEEIDRDFFYRRIKKAIEYREKILGFKNTYRDDLCRGGLSTRYSTG